MLFLYLLNRPFNGANSWNRHCRLGTGVQQVFHMVPSCSTSRFLLFFMPLASKKQHSWPAFLLPAKFTHTETMSSWVLNIFSQNVVLSCCFFFGLFLSCLLGGYLLDTFVPGGQQKWSVCVSYGAASGPVRIDVKQQQQEQFQKR